MKNRKAAMKLQKKHIEDEWDEGEPSKGGNGYWVALKKGWRWKYDSSRIDPRHTMRRDTKREVYAQQIEPCDCLRCEDVE